MRDLLLAASLLLLGAALASAQQTELPVLLRTADELIADGECEHALRLLESVAEHHAESHEVMLALQRAYLCAEDYQAAHAIIDQLIERATNVDKRLEYLVQKSRIYLRAGHQEEAEMVFQSAIDLEPRLPKTYRDVAQAYMLHGYYSDAVRIYQQGRARLNDLGLFASEVGRLYEIMRDYGSAAVEYFQLVTTDSTQVNLANGRMRQLIQSATEEEFDTGLEEALRKLVAQHPENVLAHKYYGEFLIAMNMLPEAFARYRVADSLGEGDGDEIVYFCQLASERGDVGMVEAACDYLRGMHPDSPSIVSAGFILGRAYFEAQRYDDAIAIFEDISQRAGASRDIAEAMFLLGYARYQGLQDPQGAIATFEELISKYPTTGSAKITAMYVADCRLSLAEPLVAESLYLEIPLRSLPQRFQEQLLFHKGELYFFLGEYDAAREAYGELMNAFPKSVFVNDCLRRIMLITEHPDMEELTLRLFSEAVYAEFRFDYDSALVMLGRLKRARGTMLGELSWFRSGEVHRQLAKAEEALAEFDSLISLYPEGSYAPLAIERKGDIYAGLQNDYEMARRTYEKLLLDYPDCLNEEQVRKKLNRVEAIISGRERVPKS